MWRPRLERLEVLLSRMDRPGGMYPPLALASAELSTDERDAIDTALLRTALAPAWEVWRDATRTAADRAEAIAELDPSFAHVHLLLADLFLRDESAHAEPFPRLRASITALRPALGHAYARLLETLKHDFDHHGEWYASRRGFGHSADEATPLLETASERACFARGRMAWGSLPPPALHPELLAEILERRLRHTPGGASADLTPDELAALEAPELLTSLRLWGRDAAVGLPLLARTVNLRELSLSFPDVGGQRDFATLPLESLSLDLAATARATLPPWIANLASLRSLSLRYTVRGADAAAVAVPAELSSLARLEALTLGGVGTLPDDLGRLASLRTLVIRGWELVGLPPSITELARLERLCVDPALALPDVPDGFERLTALRDLRLGHLDTPALPRVLLRMPWLTRVHLIAARRWPEAQQAELRAALPGAHVSITFTGNARP